MPLRIEEINAKDIGPINQINITLRNINLIYGKNEQGKTIANSAEGELSEQSYRQKVYRLSRQTIPDWVTFTPALKESVLAQMEEADREKLLHTGVYRKPMSRDEEITVKVYGVEGSATRPCLIVNSNLPGRSQVRFALERAARENCWLSRIRINRKRAKN